MKKDFKYLLVIISVCGLIASSMGLGMSTSGLFYDAVCESLATGKSAITLTYTIMVITSSIVGIFVPKILNKLKSLKLLVSIATTLMVGGTCLLSISNSVFLLYLFSFVRGVGCGLINFVLCTIVINNWFYKHRGLLISIMMMFSGLPAMLLSFMIVRVIANYSWQIGYLFVAALMLLFNLPALLSKFTLTPEEQGLKVYGIELAKTEEKVQVKQNVSTIKQTPFVVKVILLVVFSFASAFISAGTQLLPGLANAYALDNSYSASINAAVNASNFISKLIFGVIATKIGSVASTMTYCLINGGSLLLLLLFKMPIIIVVAAFMFGVATANSSVGISLLTSDLFGLEQYAKVYPYFSFTGYFANAIGAVAFGYLYDISQSYAVIFIACLLLQLIVVLALLFIAGIRRKSKEC